MESSSNKRGWAPVKKLERNATLVTGAARGTGAAIQSSLRADGAPVAINYALIPEGA